MEKFWRLNFSKRRDPCIYLILQKKIVYVINGVEVILVHINEVLNLIMYLI